MGSNAGSIIKAALPMVVAAATTAAGFPEFAPYAAAATGGVEGATGPQGSPLGAITGAAGGYAGGELGSGLYTGGSALAGGSSLGDAFAAGFPSAASTLGIGDPALTSTANLVDAAGDSVATGGMPVTAAQAGTLGTTGGNLASVGGGAIGAGGGGASSFSSLPIGSLLAGVSGVTNAAAINSAENQMKKEQEANQALLEPYTSTGKAAASNLSGLLNPGTAQTDLENTPGYQFELAQGTKALNNANAAAGNLDSGEALKAAEQFGQGLAGTTYNTAVNQNLAAAGLGSNAAGTAAGINTNLGNIMAGGTMGQANNVANTLMGIANPQNAAIAALLRSLSGQSSVAY